MKKIRVIARLDVKSSNVIKGVHLECLKVVGEPHTLSKKYYLDGIDEILYIDSVASLYGRKNIINIVKKASNDIFVPLTVGGGIKTLEDIKEILRAGADKVAINTAVIKNPNFISSAAKMFGSQCIVVSVEAKKKETGYWEAYTDNGREKTGKNLIRWVKEAESLGAGEILVTSIDKEGTKSGFDLELAKAISQEVSVPVVISGGAGSLEHIVECIKYSNADGVALASVLHYNQLEIPSIKNYLSLEDIPVRIVVHEYSR